MIQVFFFVSPQSPKQVKKKKTETFLCLPQIQRTKTTGALVEMFVRTGLKSTEIKAEQMSSLEQGLNTNTQITINGEIVYQSGEEDRARQTWKNQRTGRAEVK